MKCIGRAVGKYRLWILITCTLYNLTISKRQIHATVEKGTYWLAISQWGKKTDLLSNILERNLDIKQAINCSNPVQCVDFEMLHI